MPKTIDQLIENIKKYDDTIIVLGQDILSSENKVISVDEKSKLIFNRKNMIKEPKFYWTYYYGNVYSPNRVITEEEKSIANLINKIGKDKVRIINGTMRDMYEDYSDIDSIDITGNISNLTCIKNHHNIDTKEFMNKAKEINFKCPECGSAVKPTVLMYGESYDPVVIDSLDKMISNGDATNKKLNSHNIIFIGADFDNDIFNDIFESFTALKNNSITKDEAFYSVIITEHKAIELERYEPDFGTSDSIKDSVDRLIELF